MNLNNLTKKILSILCVGLLFVGVFSGVDFESKAAEESDACLTFYSTEAFSLSMTLYNYSGKIYITTDKDNWGEDTWGGSSTAAAQAEEGGYYYLYLRGTDSTAISQYMTFRYMKITSESDAGVYCTGDIMTLLDYEAVAKGEEITMGSYAFYNLFKDCTLLKSAPTLSATTLSTSCYQQMFYGCTGLEEAPELPATTLASYCYAEMFYGCTALKAAPELPAETLDTYCYNNMFYGCSSLETAYDLPAATLTNYCYNAMFYGCSSLKETPEIFATTLADYCCAYMFSGCTSLTSLPQLSATEGYIYCYRNMFYGCSGIYLSTTQTDEYCHPWSLALPESSGSYSFSYYVDGMFVNIGGDGSVGSEPSAGVTYYIKASHTYSSEPTSTTEATCLAKATKTYTCTYSGCDASYTDEIGELADHTLGAAATCTTDQSCSVCGYIANERTGHSYSSAVTNPTCTEAGYTTYTCTNTGCSHSYTSDTVTALGHSYTGVITTAATATTKGVMTYTCSTCNDSYAVAIPATGTTVSSGSSTSSSSSSTSISTSATDTVVTSGNTTVTTESDDSISVAVSVDTSNILSKAEQALVEADENAIISLVLTVEEVVETAVAAALRSEIIETVVEEVNEALSSAASTSGTVSSENITITYLDISFMKEIIASGGETSDNITELANPIQITISIPEDMVKSVGDTSGSYYIVRVHDGQVDILDTTFDTTAGTLTFETDRFSTYAIVFVEDVVEEAVAVTPAVTTTSPKTGESGLPLAGVAVIVLCLGVIIMLSRKSSHIQ